MNALCLQPKLEELVLRLWGYDGLLALLSAFIINSSVRIVLIFEDGSMEDDSRSEVSVVADCTQRWPYLCVRSSRSWS